MKRDVNQIPAVLERSALQGPLSFERERVCCYQVRSIPGLGRGKRAPQNPEALTGQPGPWEGLPSSAHDSPLVASSCNCQLRRWRGTKIMTSSSWVSAVFPTLTHIWSNPHNHSVSGVFLTFLHVLKASLSEARSIDSREVQR